MLWALVGEVFDIAGDYAMFFGIHAAYEDTAENRAIAAPVYMLARVCPEACDNLWGH